MCPGCEGIINSHEECWLCNNTGKVQDISMKAEEYRGGVWMQQESDEFDDEEESEMCL